MDGADGDDLAGGDAETPAPPRPPAAVLFDMDGVLVDTEGAWHELERELLAEAVVGDVDAREVQGINYRETYDYLEERYDLRMDRATFEGRYEDAAEDVYAAATLLPGVRDLLARLRAAGVAVAVVSSSRPDWMRLVVEEHDLAFDALVSVEEIEGPGKPAPDVYEAAARRVGAAPERCVAVEDSANGIAAAASAGTYCVGYGPASDGVDRSAAAVVVRDPEALVGLLADLAGG